ncbi:MAG: redoxin domain-containing protein [Phycisphaerae bacterium]
MRPRTGELLRENVMRLFWSCPPLLVSGLLTAAALGDDPDLVEIIAKVDQTAKAVKLVSYQAEAWGEGISKDEMPRSRATVRAKDTGDKVPLLRFDGVVKMPGSDQMHPFHLVLGERQVIALDEKRKVCTVGDLPEGFNLIAKPMKDLFMAELLHPAPFSDELAADSRKYEGEKNVAGTACHVIYVVYADGQGEARWYFGIDDSLPHRVDRVVQNDQGQGVHVLQLSDINTAPRFDDATFATNVPRGYQERRYERPAKRAKGLLEVGTQAPDWTLKTPTGESVSLAKLRGKIVVLDFWATWCGPCIKAMPGVQKLHEKFEGKPVAVFGVNTWENKTADPAAFMKNNDYTYGLLMNGDEVATAYGVRALPTFYVIGPDGKILHASKSFSAAGEEALSKLIETTLAKNE